jgi:putative nucleotidyltransferase with HDIG domain
MQLAFSEISQRRDQGTVIEYVKDVNRELWLVLSLFVIAGIVNWLVKSNGMLLALYALPTLYSAYTYGRRHAVMTAVASIILVVSILWTNPELLVAAAGLGELDRWMSVVVWGASLTITAYAMGTLYDRKEKHFRELRHTYFGVLTILQQFISNDKYTHNHSYRVAMYASSIATRMGFDEARVDDIRAAALIHDIGKLETSRDILHKASSLSSKEMFEMRGHVKKGGALLETMGGSLSRILPIVLAHHEKYDGTGYEKVKGDDIPIEARVLSLADAYDTLTSDRPYRRAITPFEAKDLIVKGTGGSFDPRVVEAFVDAFDAHQLEMPDGLVLV